MEYVISVNITAAVLILMVLVARRYFLFYFSKKMWILLWKITALRILFPFSIPLPKRGIFVAEKVIWMPISDAVSANAVISKPIFQDILGVIWLLGSLGCITYFLIIYIKSRSIYKISLLVKSEFFERWKGEHKLKRQIEIRESDQILSPLTYGIFNPVILLPKTIRDLSESQLRLVLEHEFTHIKHIDVFYKWILVIICTIYWFNPLLWIMYLRVNRDMELACDEEVLQFVDKNRKKSYMDLLIFLEERKSIGYVFANAFTKNATEERLLAIIKENSRRSHMNGVITFIIIFSFTVFSIVSMAESSGTTSGVQQEVPNVLYMNGYDAQVCLNGFGFNMWVE